MPSPMHELVLSLAVLALVACKKARSAPAAPDAAPPPAPASAESGPPQRVRHGGSDATFVVASDTHFGFGGIEEVNDRIIDRIGALPGKPWPSSIGGSVDPIDAVVVTGDLTEWGKEEEWARFALFYGGRGTKAKLTLPVFEMIGNHDKVVGPFVEQKVRERHGGRFYAWDFGDLHCVALGEAPDDEGLAFLAKDLARLASDVPVMIFFHLALDGPWSTEHWFARGDFKARLADTLAGHAVVAIVHGHQHSHGRYTWRGFDVVKPGAAKHSDHSFMVMRATDEKLSVAWLDFDRDAWIGSFEKAMPARQRSLAQ